VVWKETIRNEWLHLVYRIMREQWEASHPPSALAFRTK
jgi:hypothetical protein